MNSLLPQRSTFIDSFQHPRTQILLVSAGVLTSLKLLLLDSPFSAVSLLSGLAMLYPHSVSNFYAGFQRFCKQRRWSAGALLGLFGGFATAWLILGGFVSPASAAKPFFGGAEEWMGGAFTGIDKKILALVFNVLRGLIVLYLGINLVKVVQAAREGDDWQTLARTPLIIVVTVTMGDLLTAMIVGTGGTGTTTTP